jgi:DNA-binding MarR family transcriptional regulator
MPRSSAAHRARSLERFAAAVLDGSAAAASLQAAVAARVGLSPADIAAVELLARRGPLTAGELGAATALASASVTGLIDRLEAARFVRRVRDPQDGRRVRVETRPDGMRRIGEALRHAGIDMETLAAGHTVAELDLISGMLERLAARVRAGSSAG